MAAKLYFNPFIPAFSSNGAPVAGARLNVYLTGTTTRTPIYSDEALTVEHPNPVIADAAGKYPNIYLDGDIVYKVVQTDRNDVPIGDAIDPYIPGVMSSGAEAFAINAQNYADAAALAAAAVGVYTTVGAGESATTNGQSFYVASGGDVTLYINNAGTGDAVASLTTAAALASSNPGEGVDLIGTVTSPEIPNPVVLRTILLDAQVSRMLSGAGDGDTDPAAVTAETAKFQAIADTGRSFSVPEPSVFYAVNQINLAYGQMIEGCGQYMSNIDDYQFKGNGVDPVFNIGSGSLAGPRRNTLRNLSVDNAGGECIKAQYAPNLTIDNVRVRTTSATKNTIDLLQCFRALVTNCNITSNGGGTALQAFDNMNGFSVEQNTITGGSLGQAMDIGYAQGLRIVGNIVESSLDGIHVGANSTSGNGNCNGVFIAENYFEQCKTPFKLATYFSIFGLECVSNFISNALTTTVAAREACIQLGRIKGGLIARNSLLPDTTEDVFWLWLDNVSGGYENLSIKSNYIGGETPANIYALKGTYAANASVKANVGGSCNFGFIPNSLGSDNIREWVSPLIDSSASTGTLAWLTDAQKALGGKIYAIDVIDYDGGVLTDVQLSIGRTAALNENHQTINMGSLSFTNGQTPLAIASSLLLDGSDSTYRVVTAAGATAKFRIKIRYRAN